MFNGDIMLQLKQKTIHRMGEYSAALILPKVWMDAVGLQKGSKVKLSIQEQKLIIEPVITFKT